MSKNKREQEPKQPKTVEVKVLLPWAIITILLTLALGLIGGYFASIDIISDAQSKVVNSIQLTSKTEQ